MAYVRGPEGVIVSLFDRIGVKALRVVACVLLLASATACAGKHTGPVATISGRLLAVGGPPGVAARPLPGTVTLANSTSHQDHVLTVGADGRYSASVVAGTYELTGRSPAYGSGTYGCNAAKPVLAMANATAHADVYCQQM